MKIIYKCEYCDVTGTKEELQKHEKECVKNYHKKSCLTCKHCLTDGFKTVECKQGIEIPEGKMRTNCPQHEVGEMEVMGFMKMFSDLFKSKEDEIYGAHKRDEI